MAMSKRALKKRNASVGDIIDKSILAMIKSKQLFAKDKEISDVFVGREGDDKDTAVVRDVAISITLDSGAFSFVASKAKNTMLCRYEGPDMDKIVYTGQPHSRTGGQLVQPTKHLVESYDITKNEYLLSGMYAFLGKKATGKSLAMRAISRQALDQGLASMVISMGEPESFIVGREHEVFVAFAIMVAMGYRVIGIDSLRTLMNEMSGNAKKSGLSRRQTTVFTQMQKMARFYNVAFLVTVNPSSDDDAVLDGIREDLEGSAAYTATLTGAQKYGNAVHMTGMLHDRYDNRADRTLQISYDLAREQEATDVGATAELDSPVKDNTKLGGIATLQRTL